MGCWAPWSRNGKWLEGSDNVRMREVIGTIERVSSRPPFSHRAALSVVPSRGGLNITMGRGKEGSCLGFAFPSLRAVGSGTEKSRIVPGLVHTWPRRMLLPVPAPPKGLWETGCWRGNTTVGRALGMCRTRGPCCGPGWHPPAQPSALAPLAAAILLPLQLFLQASRL